VQFSTLEAGCGEPPLTLELGQRVLFRSLQWEVQDTASDSAVRLFGRDRENRGRSIAVVLGLEPIERAEVPELAWTLGAPGWDPFKWTALHHAYRLTLAHGRGSLVSVDWGRLILEPYQLVPLQRIESLPFPRLLLADDTGLGKTTRVADAEHSFGGRVDRRRGGERSPVEDQASLFEVDPGQCPTLPLASREVLPLRQDFGCALDLAARAESPSQLGHGLRSAADGAPGRPVHRQRGFEASGRGGIVTLGGEEKTLRVRHLRAAPRRVEVTGQRLREREAPAGFGQIRVREDRLLENRYLRGRQRSRILADRR